MKQQYISKEALEVMESRERATMINSLGGFKSVALIGTTNPDGLHNLAIFNSIVHIGASPALIAFVMRPHTVERHTLDNILASNYYTINHINERMYEAAHQTSAKYAREQSEYEATGLTAAFKENFVAPYVQESNVQLGMRFVKQIDLAVNGTSLIIGEVEHIYFPNNCKQADGFIDIEKAGTITCAGVDAYYSTSKLSRLSYAQPDVELKKL